MSGASLAAATTRARSIGQAGGAQRLPELFTGIAEVCGVREKALALIVHGAHSEKSLGRTCAEPDARAQDGRQLAGPEIGPAERDPIAGP